MAIHCFGSDLSHNGMRSVYNYKDGSRNECPWPEGAYCPLNDYNSIEERTRLDGRSLVMWDEYVGHCLYEWEANGRDDSDFYMMVWDTALNAPKAICFATTRGWSYPSYGSRPDATEEVLALWNAYKVEQAAINKKQERIAKAKHLRTVHKLELTLTAKHGFKLKALRQWKRTEDRERLERALHLLTSERLRSPFKLSMKEQLIAWLKEPKYKSPFTPKQWLYV